MEHQINVSFPLAAVGRNGKLGLHEDVFLALNELEQTGLILHEAMHCAHNHARRALTPPAGLCHTKSLLWRSSRG